MQPDVVNLFDNSNVGYSIHSFEYQGSTTITRITLFSSQYILPKTLASSGVRPYSFEEYWMVFTLYPIITFKWQNQLNKIIKKINW